MEKAGTASNRLTRSSARNTPSKKTEDSSDINAAEELKSNLRKSRRKTETNIRTNGDTAADIDTKKPRNYEEISDCNSMDSVDSNKSFKQKNHKTQSPTISRKSLRTRRSITPGPEAESNVTRKISRSTSESKLDSVGTPTRRSMRAKSESKDFVFTPSKQSSNDTEQSHSEANSKCIPVNPALRVIDEIIEEDNELESHNSPKTSPSQLSNEETGNSDCVPILVDVNHENDENIIVDLNKHQKNNSDVSMCQNEITQSNCLNSTDTSYIDKNQELQEKEADMTLDDDSVQKNDQLPNVNISTQSKTNNELPEKNEEVEKDSMNQEVCSQNDINKSSSNFENAGSLNNSSGQLPVAEDVESAKETSFNLSISEDSEHPNIINIEPLNEENHSMCSDDKQITKSLEEISNKPDCAEQNTSLFGGSNHSQTLELCENDKSSDAESLLQKSQTIILNTIEVEIDEESTKLQLANTISDDSKSMIEKSSKVKSLDSETPASGDENISISENNDLSVITEGQREKDNLVVGHQDSTITEIVNNVSLRSSPEKDLLNPLDFKVSQDDSTEDDEAVFICGSDSEEPDDIEGNNVVSKTVNETPVDCEEETQRVSKDFSPVDENTSQKCDEQITDTGVYENNSTVIESVENIDEQIIIPEDNSAVLIEDLNKDDVNKSPIKDGIELLQSNSDTFEQMEYTEVSITASEQLNNTKLEKPLSEEVVETPRKLTDILEERNKITPNKLTTKHLNENYPIVLNEGKESDDQRKENEEFNPLEDEEALSRDSASNSELYKDMSDFGSDVDEKKDGSQYGDSASTEVKSGDSEEYASSFEGEEDEEINNEETLISKEQEIVKNIQKKIDPKVAEKLFDTDTPMTYDKALAILNKNRVNKIDDEEFFDMFTQELNRVSEESGSDSDIAIVDEYIAEPEEQKQQQKLNKKPGNPQASLKNQQQSPPSNSVQNRSMTTEQVPKQIQINLKTTQKSDLPSNAISQPFSGAYNQHVPTEHNHQRIHFSQGGLYHQYNPTMQVTDPNRGHVMYDQFAPPNMQDSRMFHPNHTPHDNFSAGSMFSHPLGQVPDDQMHYQSGSLKVRSIDSICGAHQSNVMKLKSSNIDRPMTVNNMSNPANDNNIKMMMGVNTATMTEVNDPLNQDILFSSPTKQTGPVTNPILEILGLDKKRLKMLKKALGLNESRVKQRNKIKQMLIEEAQKMGLSLKSPANIENRVNRPQRNSSELAVKIKAKKRQLIKNKEDSDSSFINNHLGSYSELSGEELDVHSEETSSSISRKDESSNESPDEERKINLEDDGVSVTIDTRLRKKQRHRATQKAPRKKISRTNERKRTYQSSESSDEENIKQTKKKKQIESLIRPRSRERKSRHRRKMTQGKRQKKEKSTVLQSKSGTFTVDPVTATSQSESDTFSQDETSSNYLKKLKENIKKDSAKGRNKLSNMFTQHSLRELKKDIKKVDKEFEQMDQETKSKRLPAELLAKLGNEEKKTKKRKKDQSADSESDEHLDYKNRKPRKRHLSRKLNVPSVAVNKEYIPLAMPGPTQFGLKRLDKDGTMTAVEKAAKFRSDRLYGAAVKRITIMDFEG